MKRVLITGARAPVALELARRLHRQGVEVHVADSVQFPLARYSRACREFHRLPRPRQSPRAFAAAVLELTARLQPDLVLPTCEEGYWLSYLLESQIPLFSSSFEQILELHSKYRFIQLAQRLELSVPQTWLLRSEEDISRHPWQHMVFKPEFTRFGTETVIRPKLRPRLNFERHWVGQNALEGRELSTYSVAHQGKLCAHVCYQPRARTGGGAGTAFGTAHSQTVENWVRRCLQETGYSGQIGFDFMLDEQGQPWALECNPRATSGVHLLPEDFDLVSALKGQVWDPQCQWEGWTMLTIPALLAEPRLVWRKRPRPILYRSGDPLPLAASVLGLIDFAHTAWEQGCCLAEAMTYDICWNDEV